MSPDEAQQNLFPEAAPPVLPVATAAQLAELLARLRHRRRELVAACAVGLGPYEPLSPSAVQPLATIQAAIEAAEAEARELGLLTDVPEPVEDVAA